MHQCISEKRAKAVDYAKMHREAIETEKMCLNFKGGRRLQHFNFLAHYLRFISASEI